MRTKFILMATIAVFAFAGAKTVLAGTLGPQLSKLAAQGAAKAQGKAPAATFVRVGRHGNAVADIFLPHVRADGTVQVYIHAPSLGGVVPTPDQLRAFGASGIVVSKPLGVVQAWLPIGRLQALAHSPAVGRVTIPSYARTPRPPSGPVNAGGHPMADGPRAVPTGLKIDHDAEVGMQALDLQEHGATGAGVKVGVMSNGVVGLADSQAAGYLPSVYLVPQKVGKGSEGTAMLEEVHAMAPGAQLGYCGGWDNGLPFTSADFLTCYQDLAAWGANVITDDLSFARQDLFTVGTTDDGSFAHAIAQFTQAHPTIAFTSAAGNDAQSFFSAFYTPGPGATIGGTFYPSLMDFGAASGGASRTFLPVTFSTGGHLAFVEWNDPLKTNPDQLVLFLVESNGTVIEQGRTSRTLDGRPLSFLSFLGAESTARLEIACVSCANPIFLKMNFFSSGGVIFDPFTNDSILGGQKIADGVQATAAGGLTGTSPVSVNREAYSSTGPYHYGDFGALNRLAKPDIMGIDGITVSGAGGFGEPLPSGGARFCGTSAAAPNVAALIADLMQALPGQTHDFYYSALETTASQTAVQGAVPFTGCGPGTTGGYSHEFAGAGLAQGWDALKSFYGLPTTSIVKPVAVASGKTGSVTVAVGAAITYTAVAAGGQFPGDSSGCIWVINKVTQQPGASAVYTAASAGTLYARHGHDLGGGSPPMSWPQRVKRSATA